MIGRGSILSAVVGVGALVMATAPLTARQNVAQIEKVKDNLYVIKGGGGNTAAFITANGVVIVDTKLAGWGQAILDQIKTVTPQARHDDHQHAHARRPRGQQRILRQRWRSSPTRTRRRTWRRWRLQERQRAVPAEEDVQGQDYARSAATTGSISTTSGPATPTATPSSSSRR